MNTLAIKQGRPLRGVETFHLVHRRHDLSGTDYEWLTTIDRSLAIALGLNGVVVRDRDAIMGRGRPGVVMDATVSDDDLVAQIRADVSDPTTGMLVFPSSESLMSDVLGDRGIEDIGWIGTPPTV